MALKTAAEMAELYQDAINALMTGKNQNYSIPGVGSFQKMDIDKLEKGLRYYTARAAKETYGSTSLVNLNSHGEP